MSAVPTPSERIDPLRGAVLADRSVTGAALRAALTETADAWLTGLFQQARGCAGVEADGLALVAVGGYGRREPAPASDLDLVVLHRGQPEAPAVAESIWYAVWDAGIGLDHAVRSVDEALDVADCDLKAALGLLDVRHVAGDPELSASLRGEVHRRWRAGIGRRLAELSAVVAARGAAGGEVAFMVEPDLKDGRGGLRDVQALRALAAAWLLDAPDPAVTAAYTLLLDVRGELQRRLRRPGDRLVLQEQDAVAEATGHADADALLVSVSAAGRTIAFASDHAWRRVTQAVRPARMRFGRRTMPRRPLAAGVVEQGGEVVLAADADPAGDHALALRVAATAAGRGLPIAPYALARLAAEGGSPPDPWPGELREALVALLGAGPGAVAAFEALDQAGLVVRLLPEWERVRCRPQRNPVHRYTVDRHLIETAVIAGGLAHRVRRPDLLMLGALLHDIGKGCGGDHTEAGVAIVGGLGPRLGLPAADVDLLVTLVRYHLLLPEVATRRDLDDPATIDRVAQAVGDRATLETLAALTEADALATGPAAWGEWKARLVADLVRRVAGVLAGTPAARPEPLTSRQRDLAVLGRFATDVVEAGPGDLADVVTVVAPGASDLLWRVAGVLALHRLDVRDANLTAVGDTTVAVVSVTPRFGGAPDWPIVRDDLRRAVEGGLDVGGRLAERDRAYADRSSPWAPPASVEFDDAATGATVIDVRAADRPGLLYRLARALHEHDAIVRAARASTLGPTAVDAFYVVGADGLPITDATTRAALAVALRAAG